MIKQLGRKVVDHFSKRLAYRFNRSFARPELFYLKITENCNFQCKHCDIWKNKDTKDLNISEWTKIIANLKTLRKDFDVTLSGGEPLLYGNFWQLVETLQRNKVGINLNTNGSLITEEIADKIIENNFKKVEISLYSLSAELHNRLRNSDNAHQSAMQAIDYLQDKNNNTKIVVAFLLTHDNIDETIDFVKYFSNIGVWTTIQSLDSNIQPMNERTNFDNDKDNLGKFDKDKTQSIFNELFQLKEQGYKIYNRIDNLEMIKNYYLGQNDQLNKIPCLAGHKNIIISTSGNLYFCFKGPVVGNIIQKSAKQLWQSQNAKKIRKQMKNCNKLCRIMNCNYDSTFIEKTKEYLK
jgi:MoaA/NifB/PqqE/SkfB family radical SAM enzyme